MTESAPGDYTVVAEVGPDLLHLLTGWFAEQNVLLESVLVQQQSLEDRFLELTGRELR